MMVPVEGTNADLAKLLDTVWLRGKQSRFILGVDGLSRSGKTTFTERLRQTLVQKQMDVRVFHLDDHIVERKRRYDTGHDPWYEYYASQWDVPYLRENLLSKLRRGNEIVLRFYDEGSDEHITRTLLIPAECVTLVEGVFLQRAEWRSFLDYCVYLDCPRDIRFSREREAVQANLVKFENRYWKAEDYYIQAVRPAEQADLVIKS
jgi:uridine kinase